MRNLSGAWLMLWLACTADGVASQAQVFASRDYPLQVSVLNDTLDSPWGMAELPDGRWLVSEKAGRLRLLSADGRRTLAQIDNLPAVRAAGQGGLLDVAVDPDFIRNGWVYWSYSEAGQGRQQDLSGTAVARGRLRGNRLESVQVIFRQTPDVSGAGHFGSRLVFDREGMLYITLGDRQKFAPAQDIRQSLGKIMRIRPDGGMPGNNPPWPGKAALPGTYSIGHRNPQGAALHPQTGALWISEHGPQGGDEINRIQAGKNYGWPIVSYGCQYGQPAGDDCRIGGGRHAPEYIEPLSVWVPVSVAPSGMLFYTGAMFPRWHNQLLVGSLAGRSLWRLQYRADREIARERLLQNLGERIRDVAQMPDGSLLLLCDSGKLYRVSVSADRKKGGDMPSPPMSMP